MSPSQFQIINLIIRSMSVVLLLVVALSVSTVYLFYFYEPASGVIGSDEFENDLFKSDSIDLAQVDFIVDEGYELVVANCTNCHSSKLVTQNRATAEGWKNTITWMQQTQNLWDLGADEKKIIAYLAKNYAPAEQGRRKNLENIEWYTLEPSQ